MLSIPGCYGLEWLLITSVQSFAHSLLQGLMQKPSHASAKELVANPHAKLLRKVAHVVPVCATHAFTNLVNRLEFMISLIRQWLLLH